MPTDSFDINELKRRMQGATQSLKHELGGLRTGRAAASMLEPVQVDAYGTHMPLNQLATISVPEPRLLSVQVWDKSMVKAVEKAIVDSNLGLSPATEGQVLRLRIPELNEERRKELVKVAHKYAEAAKVAVRHVRRDGLDTVKKLEKNHEISEDDQDRLEPTVPCMWRSSWTETGAGQRPGVCRARKVIAGASRPCAASFAPPTNSVSCT